MHSMGTIRSDSSRLNSIPMRPDVEVRNRKGFQKVRLTAHYRILGYLIDIAQGGFANRTGWSRLKPKQSGEFANPLVTS